MQRLLQKDKGGEVMERLVEEVYTFKGKVEDCENDYFISVQEKLREYEGLEEQGLLLRLPCDVMSKTVFLTQAEAEAKLKELRCNHD